MVINGGYRPSAGFAYLGLLLVIAMMGAALAGAGTLWSAAQRRDREQELLHIGHKFREAIGQYYESTPGVVKQYPPTLEALLRDDRFPRPRRYLRKIYVDPISGMSSWGILEAPSGGVMGVYSLGIGTPYQQSNFSQDDKAFEGKKYYEEWIFAYIPNAVMGARQ